MTIQHRNQLTATYAAMKRFGLLTPIALQALRPDLFALPRSAGELLTRLSNNRVIKSANLYEGHPFYFRDGEKCSESTKVRSYAMLAVCTANGSQRMRLTRSEFARYFPDVCRPGLPMNYYIDLTTQRPVLGFIRIDRGGHCRWDRIVAKTLDDARKHRLEPAFERFTQRQALEIRIVTALPQKADRIRRALIDHPNPSGIPIQISVLPELINLIAPVTRTVPH